MLSLTHHTVMTRDVDFGRSVWPMVRKAVACIEADHKSDPKGLMRPSWPYDAEMIRGCLEAAEAASERLGMKIHVAISLPHCAVGAGSYRHLSFGGCSLSSGAPGFTIDPWGRLRACSVSPEILGDLRTEDWDAIMGRAREGYLRDLCAMPEACMSCAALRRCRGGCRESALAVSGGFGAMDPLVD